MKKYLLLAIFAAIVFSCSDKPDMAKEIMLSIQLILPEGDDVVAPPSYKIAFKNEYENYYFNITAGPDGTATVRLRPGLYDIIVSARTLTKIYSGGSEKDVIVADENHRNIDIDIVETGALVFKELYYCGSPPPGGGIYFRDQFYEIYNNSEEMLYVDGLCIAIIYSNLASANQPNWNIENQGNYVFLYQAWQLPGNGTEYPLEPGESIIICQWATNHITSISGNPNSLDLSSGEFEAIIPGVTNAIMTDGPPINMKLVFNSQSNMLQWLTTVNGAAFVIFFPDATVNFSTPITQVGASARGVPVPVKMIVDAVECVTNAASVQQKRVPLKLDAGAIYVSGQYVKESVARKIEETTADGRHIYQDTNNSTEDFEVQKPPVIRRNGAKKPAWNTWGN